MSASTDSNGFQTFVLDPSHMEAVLFTLSGGRVMLFYEGPNVCLYSKYSDDEGQTWKHHRNLESPDDTAHVPAPPVQVYRRSSYGKMTDAQGRLIGNKVVRRICYPSVAFLGDEVLVCYDFDQADRHVTKLRILPLGWFYER